MPKFSEVRPEDIRTKGIHALMSDKQLKIYSYVRAVRPYITINHGAKRSGKTVLDNALFVDDVRQQGIRARSAGVKTPQYILAGAELSTLYRNVLLDIENDYGIPIKFDRANRFEMFGVLVCCFGHSNIKDLGRIRGMTAYGAYINEASMANEMVFDEIISRCSAPGARILMDTNPDMPGHWLKKKYIDKADGKVTAQFHWRLEDNTFLDPEYVANQKARTPSGMFYDRNIRGLWVAAEGAVYPDFNRAVHLIPASKVPDIARYYAGMDFGWEHSGSLVLMGEDYDGNTYLLRGWCEQHKGIDWWARIIKDAIEPMTGDLTVYCDSARPDLINDLQCSGVDARNAHKDVVAGIGEVATRLKTDTLYIVHGEDEDFDKKFDSEIDSYVWKEGCDEPVKANDDIMDSMRYAIYSDKVENEEQVTIHYAPFMIGGI